ncbi:MAG: prepilin-type N-terminal cleavage/methylation domain-containing protein [Deltaproteobacteria bacterium]|nr:prepilin-type N-terminal cleavage/methylation domain-containing protein [Deltaproteobacteria bacterium]
MRRAKGLTLIELTVVLAIIGAVMLLVLPRVATFSAGTQLKSGARALAAVARLARSEAICRAETMDLHLDLDRNLVAILRREDGHEIYSEQIDRRLKIEEVVIRRYGLTSVPVIVFRSNGRASEAAIYLVAGKEVLTLHLEPLTGQMQFLPGRVRYDWAG